MICRSNNLQSQELKTACRLLGATLAAVVLVFTVLVSAGEAQACPPGMKSETSVSLAHQVKLTMVVTSQVASTASHANPRRLVTVGHHCAGNCQSGASCCQTGFCSACPAGVVSISDLQPPKTSTDYGFSVQGGILSIKPPPDFRPPKTFA
jgi:hypothetical protein